jgi:two-component system nitrogen regulation sensor histidine kinase GlnL
VDFGFKNKAENKGFNCNKLARVLHSKNNHRPGYKGVIMSPMPVLSDAVARKLVDSLSTALVYLDEALEIQYLNPAAEMLLGTSARQVKGINLKDLLPAEDPLLEHADTALGTLDGVAEWEAQLTVLRRDPITVDISITPIEEDGIVYLLVELQPVDRHIRAYREEQQREQHDLSREVIRGLAHEIKNPLGGLRGAAQLLERQIKNDVLKEYTGIITSEADRLRDLVDRLLGPAERLTISSINVHEVVEYVRQLLEAELDGRDIAVVRDYDPSIPDIAVDREQIIQAVLNIARNGAQAIGDEGRLILRTRTERQYTIGSKRVRLAVRIDVEDSGAGIAPEMQDKIFYPMVTGRDDGTGLGLPIAQNILNQHGGIIECQSQPGKTIFSLIIPLEA